ncbi:MAG: FliH/SctL family protein [Thermodesulfobacteriota bacterium]
MSRIIKAQQGVPVQEAPAVETEEFLSFTDFWQPKADGEAAGHEEEVIRDPREIAEEEAAEIVRRAREEAAAIEAEARERGFAAGEEAGKAEGQRQFQERIDLLDTVLRDLDSQRAMLQARQEEDMLALIKAMVDRLVHHEVSVNPLVIQACLKKAMEFVVENSMVHIHLHGEDFNRLKKAALDNPRLLEGKNRLQLVEDPSVSMGGCLLKTDFGEIGATLEECRDKLYAAVDRAFHEALASSSAEENGAA